MDSNPVAAMPRPRREPGRCDGSRSTSSSLPRPRRSRSPVAAPLARSAASWASSASRPGGYGPPWIGPFGATGS
eukprot:1505826-Lingulodinium_polyedra.AAC.1